MKTKEQLQDELIEMFEKWFKRGKPLGYDNGRTMINIYDSEVKKLNIPAVIKSVCGDCIFYLTCKHESRDKQICVHFDDQP